MIAGKSLQNNAFLSMIHQNTRWFQIFGLYSRNLDPRRL
jgi:hypothetical protein